MAFDNILGHEAVRGLLARTLHEGRLPPSLLFCGPEGVGKKTLALTVARSLLCVGGGGGTWDPCDRCPPCSRSLRGLHPDMILVEPATATIKIDQIRGAVREIAGRPFEGRSRAVLIDDAHVMTEEASNALLKCLEEPPATSHVFLVTAAPQALLPTIRSRCQVLRFRALPARLVEAHLREHGLSMEEARLRASLSGGSLAAALAFESEAYRALREGLLALLERLGAWGPLERMEAAQRLAELEDPGLALTVLRSLLRDVAVLRAGARPERLLNADVVGRLQALAPGSWARRATALAGMAGQTRTGLGENANRLLSMDLLIDALASAQAA